MSDPNEGVVRGPSSPALDAGTKRDPLGISGSSVGGTRGRDESRRELAAFLRWLIETTQVTDRPWDVVEKPWKWSTEHDTYLREEAAERLADEDEAFAELERRRGPA
jgi:hypothetical protein